MKVVVVDDGSTDTTLVECRRVAECFSNIEVVSLPGGPSGSASRARNAGIDSCETELVTFLDPDNEISEDGYDRLLSDYRACWNGGEDIDFVSGFQVKVGARSVVYGKHSDDGVLVVDDPMVRFFASGGFPTVSSQAAVIRADFLLEQGIRFVEGAVGQDTLFGWELLARSSKAAFTDSAHLIYYSGRTESVTNIVDADYFRRSLHLESVQKHVLEDLGVLEAFVEHQLPRTMEKWYLPQFDRVSGPDRERCLDFLRQISELYSSAMPTALSDPEGS